MSETNQPVDNSHRDAGIAARDARNEAAKEEVVQEAAEAVEQDIADDADDTQNTPEASAATDSGDAPAAPRKKKPGVHERIDELTKSFRSAERDRDYWRELAMKSQQQPQQPEAQAQPQDTGEPTLESCDFDVGKFNRQWYDWRKSEDQKIEQQQARQRKSQESFAAFRADHPDFDAVVTNPALTITQAMASEVEETDNPAAVAYYLGQNPAEAAAIAQMGERAMSRAIGRIEARLSAQPAAPAPRQPEPKTVTRAPAPVTTLSGAPAVSKSYDQMSMKEYDAQRQKERAAKGLR